MEDELKNILDNVQVTLLKCSSSLENSELDKEKIKAFIDDVLSDKQIPAEDKIKFVERAWNIYKEYESDIITAHQNNIKAGNDLIADINNFNKE